MIAPRHWHAFTRRMLGAIALVACCSIALRDGVRTTHDLRWAPGQDLSRDQASAESILSGHPLSDPWYLGEWVWYNPLVPGVAATVSAAIHRPVPIVYARIGAYANLLAPLALFALVALMFDGWTAAFALVGFLFVVPELDEAWLGATYSPWFMPVHFVQGLCYLTLLTIWWAWRKRSRGTFGIAGALAGLVFLGHTAPALMIGTTVAGLTLWSFAVGRPDSRRAVDTQILGHVMTFVLTAVAVSAPYLFSILGHYRGRVVNSAPVRYAPPQLEPGQILGFLQGQFDVTPTSIVAMIGAAALVATRDRSSSRVLLMAALSTVLWFAYSSAVLFPWNDDGILPVVVPSFHFFYYFRAFEAMAFGIGVATCIRLAVRVVHGRTRMSPESVRLMFALTVYAALAVTVWSGLERYRNRGDFVAERASALEMFQTPGLRQLYRFVRDQTPRDSVFLAHDSISLSVIGVAGRKTVVLDKFFSNPFVSWEARDADKRHMEDALDRGDWAGFAELAGKYRLRFVVTEGPLPKADVLACCLRPVWESNGWLVYEVQASAVRE